MKGKYYHIILRILFMLSIPLISIIHVILNRERGTVNIIKTFLDDKIPFNKFFVIPYIYWFGFVFIILLYFAVVDSNNYYRLLASILSGMLICFAIYYFFPTTVPRPDIVGNDSLSNLVRFIYSKDNPYNCFPSIHVLNAMLVTLFFCKYYKGIILKGIVISSCVLINLSTLFIKQHYTPDVLASLLLSTTLYLILGSNYLSRYLLTWTTRHQEKASSSLDTL
jgi:hypothetical protein